MPSYPRVPIMAIRPIRNVSPRGPIMAMRPFHKLYPRVPIMAIRPFHKLWLFGCCFRWLRRTIWIQQFRQLQFGLFQTVFYKWEADLQRIGDLPEL